MIIESLTTRRVESTPNQDPTLGAGARHDADKRGATAQVASDTVTLSPEAQSQISKLQKRDSEVRSHEQAHIAAAGPHAQGGANYEFTTGPDNRQYATGGSVRIDTSPVPGDPEATQEKARLVRSAALAPGQPSAQDQSVAAQAATLEQQAQAEESQDKQSTQTGHSGSDKNPRRGGEHGGASALAVNDAVQPADKDTPVGAQNSVASGARAAHAPDIAPASAADRVAPAAANVRPDAHMALTPGAEGAAAASAKDNPNVGGLLGLMEFQVRGTRAVAAYQAQQDKFVPVSALAPWGTGIEITV